MDDKNFSTYFIIKDYVVLSTKNFTFEEKLTDCYYVRKLGSNAHPKFYVDIKKDNNWIVRNSYIGDYISFMDFVLEHKNSFICIRGFSKAYIGHFISNINKLVECNLLNKNRYIIADKRFLKDKYKTLKKEDRLIVKDKTSNNEIIDVVVWRNGKYEALHDRELKNAYIGEKIKARNIEQRMAIDLLLNQDIKVKLLVGGWGSGKTLLALTYAFEQIGRGKYDKLVFVRNNIITANTKDVGSKVPLYSNI